MVLCPSGPVSPLSPSDEPGGEGGRSCEPSGPRESSALGAGGSQGGGLWRGLEAAVRGHRGSRRHWGTKDSQHQVSITPGTVSCPPRPPERLVPDRLSTTSPSAVP